MYDLIKQFPVERWKIYQYIPEGPIVDASLCVGNELFAFIKERFIQSLDRQDGRLGLDISFSSAADRDSAYFIVQPLGDVIIPSGDNEATSEVPVGNLLTDPVEVVVDRWSQVASMRNHRSNLSVLNRPLGPDTIDRKILFEVDRNPTVSPEALAVEVGESIPEVTRRLEKLFQAGVIKYSMPIVNLERLGFGIYLIDVQLKSDADIERAVAPFEADPNIGWLASTDVNSLIAAVFARSINEGSAVVDRLAESVGEDVLSVAVSTVYEKYVLGQRYLTIAERVTDFVFDNSRIEFIGERGQDLTTVERSALGALRNLKTTSLDAAAEQNGLSRVVLDEAITDLRRRGIIVKFQPVYDVQKLGYRWFLVDVKLSWLNRASRERFIDHLHALTSVVHINCMLGQWQLNFEVHVNDRTEVDRIILELQETFPSAISELAVREVLKEHKFNFMSDAVLQAADEETRPK
jgi:DNA-binding Lrp family transcriptional regulator